MTAAAPEHAFHVAAAQICEKHSADFVPLRLGLAFREGDLPCMREGCRNICELKTKHLSHRCKPAGNMCESRPGSHSVFSNILAEESDRNRLSRCSSNQMHVQAMQHLVFSLFTAKIYSRSVHSCRHVGALMPTPAQFAACKQLSRRTQRHHEASDARKFGKLPSRAPALSLAFESVRFY